MKPAIKTVEQQVYLVKDTKGFGVELMAYKPTEQLLADFTYMTTMERRKKYKHTASSHMNMLGRIKTEGVKVSPAIRKFDNFLRLVGPNPRDLGSQELYTFDRINSYDHLYSPDRCRWATKQLQAENKTNVNKLTYQGETRTLKEWSKITGVAYTTIKSRVEKGLKPHEILKLTPSAAKLFWGKMLIFCDPNSIESLYRESHEFLEDRIDWLALILMTSLVERKRQAFPNFNKSQEHPKTPKTDNDKSDYIRWLFNNLNHDRLSHTGKAYFWSEGDSPPLGQSRFINLVPGFLTALFYLSGENPPKVGN